MRSDARAMSKTAVKKRRRFNIKKMKQRASMLTYEQVYCKADLRSVPGRKNRMSSPPTKKKKSSGIIRLIHFLDVVLALKSSLFFSLVEYVESALKKPRLACYCFLC